MSSSIGGAREDRTPDPLRARQVLSQLSYGPNSFPVTEFCAGRLSGKAMCTLVHESFKKGVQCKIGGSGRI